MINEIFCFLTRMKDRFMCWLKADKMNLKIAGTKVITTGLIIAALANMTGCYGQLVGDKPSPHTKHPLLDDKHFAGEFLPETYEVRPLAEIEETGILAEDVLSVYDQLAMLALHRYWAPRKEQWGDDFNNLSATFTSITPNWNFDTNVLTGERENRMKKYYTYSDSFDGTQVSWQYEPQTYTERVYGICFNMDIGYKGEKIDSGVFDPFGILESDFLLIAEGFGSIPFEITREKLEQLYGSTGTTITMVDENQTGYSAFTIDRDTILNITDKKLLWSLYNAAQNSLYSVNFNKHYNTYHNLEIVQ